jgi:hypothetical protein
MGLIASILAIVFGLVIFFWTVGLILDLIGIALVIVGIVWLVRHLKTRRGTRI